MTRHALHMLALTALVAIGACEDPAPPQSRGCAAAQVDPRSEPRWVALAETPDLEVFVEGARAPVAGRMAEGPTGPAFYPVFPFTPGLAYRVRGGGCDARFVVPPNVSSTPEVVGIYPTSSAIPENILRFYLYFSEPMAEGDFLQHVRLEHVEQGVDLTGVFFDNIYELWSPDRKRITLLVDPGRVKTGLQAHRALGRAFEAGQTYRLSVLGTWTSLAGHTLRVDTTKTYRAVSEDRVRVDPDHWCLTLPPAGTTLPLKVDFAEAVDHVSVGRFLQVTSAQGEVLPGTWRLDEGETLASWTPEKAWSGPVDAHQLRINGRFEDVAGNNINASMDHRQGTLPPGDEGRTIIRSLTTPCR